VLGNNKGFDLFRFIPDVSIGDFKITKHYPHTALSSEENRDMCIFQELLSVD
jgi:hypothetical protein